jgi:hypothetical protein
MEEKLFYRAMADTYDLEFCTLHSVCSFKALFLSTGMSLTLLHLSTPV